MSGTTVAIIGSGRVAGALSRAFFRSGITISAVLSRNHITGNDLALEVGAEYSSRLVVPHSAFMAIIAVPDSAVAAVASEAEICPDTIIVHTSGSTGLDVFPGHLKRTGVIYPLQTFSRGREVDMRELHYFTEASGSEVLREIDAIVGRLGSNIHHADSETRRVLHLAAVFVSNFVNHMIYAGMAAADRKGIDRSVFGPLIRETVSKALDLGPQIAQTGPAARNDTVTIEKHIELLSFSDELSKLYRIVSDSIAKQVTKSDNE